MERSTLPTTEEAAHAISTHETDSLTRSQANRTVQMLRVGAVVKQLKLLCGSENEKGVREEMGEGLEIVGSNVHIRRLQQQVRLCVDEEQAEVRQRVPLAVRGKGSR